MYCAVCAVKISLKPRGRLLLACKAAAFTGMLLQGQRQREFFKKALCPSGLMRGAHGGLNGLLVILAGIERVVRAPALHQLPV